MATKSNPLYGRITSAQVLEVLKYSSGSDLKTQQAQLTATCNQLEQLSTPSIGLSELLDMDDRDLLKRAAGGRLREGAESYAKALASDILR